MNALEAATIVAYMQSCWPEAVVSEDTAAVWAEQLVNVDPEDGLAAARSLMRSSRWFPKLAEFVEQSRVERRRRTGNSEGRAAAAGVLPVEAESLAGVARDEVLELLQRTRSRPRGVEHDHRGPDPCKVCGGMRSSRGGL